jgi:predicted transposase YbfD/YdcC
MAEPITIIFSRLTDPRADRGRRHRLIDIVTIAILATLCGAESWTDMEDFGLAREPWLKKFLKLRHGIPSEDTFAAVFAAIDPDQFERCFRAWTLAVAGEIVGILAIDGKTIRGSGDARHDRSPVHMISAWAVDNGIVFGQLATDQKSNEITAIPQLLQAFNLKGLIVTIDAMGCQKEIAQQIHQQKGEYVLQVKGHQPELHNDIKTLFDWAQVRGFDGMKHARSEQTDIGHGRLETRRVDVLWDLRQIKNASAWAGLRCVVRVHCTRTLGEATSMEDHYYISSVQTKRSEELGRACRAHWGIENGLHWCLDVNFGEDLNQTRAKNAAQNLSRLRRLVLNLLKLDTSKKISMRRKRFRASLEPEYLALLFSLLAVLPA